MRCIGREAAINAFIARAKPYSTVGLVVTVVILFEMPVMLTLVAFANRTRARFPA